MLTYSVRVYRCLRLLLREYADLKIKIRMATGIRCCNGRELNVIRRGGSGKIGIGTCSPTPHRCLAELSWHSMLYLDYERKVRDSRDSLSLPGVRGMDPP